MQGFVVPQINLFLPVCPPIVAETVHLAVLDYQEYIGDICWALAFFGCPLPERKQPPLYYTCVIHTASLVLYPTKDTS